MEIELHKIPIREVAKGYIDDAESGCRGYSGRLNIRPAFQREFIYGEKQRNAVIETVKLRTGILRCSTVNSARYQFANM